MPKLKTHRGAAKRFNIKANGDVAYRQTNRSHLNTKMTAKRKRHLRINSVADGTESKRIKSSIQ
jgi:large subunit ribosomal protein L35